MISQGHGHENIFSLVANKAYLLVKLMTKEEGVKNLKKMMTSFMNIPRLGPVYRVSHIEMRYYRRWKKAQSNLFFVISWFYFQVNLWIFWNVNLILPKKSRGGLINPFLGRFEVKNQKNFFKKSWFFSIHGVPLWIDKFFSLNYYFG